MTGKFRADAQLEPSIVQEKGRTFVQLENGHNVIRIPSEKFHELHGKLMRFEREQGNNVRYNPDRGREMER